MSDSVAAITAERVRLSSAKREVYPPLTFQVPAGSMAALHGASGTGKSALLLTLAGRMRSWHGHMSVCGLDAARDARRVRGCVGLGLMSGVNDFTESLTAEQHLAEQRVFVPRSRQSGGRDPLARVGLDAAAALPVRALDAEQRVRLGIALALVRDISVLVVDDLDSDLDEVERARVLELLRGLADEGLAVVYACVDEATASAADVVIAMDGESVVSAEVAPDAVA